MFEKSDLEKILPHRGSMMLLDRAEVDENGTAHGYKTITGNEFFLDGHFPQNPIVPGVILCEILAQSACVLLADKAASGVTTLFTGLDKVKFRSPVRPGQTVETQCRITAQKGQFYWAEGKCTADGKLCAAAQFSFALIGSEDK